MLCGIIQMDCMKRCKYILYIFHPHAAMITSRRDSAHGSPTIGTAPPVGPCDIIGKGPRETDMTWKYMCSTHLQSTYTFKSRPVKTERFY